MNKLLLLIILFSGSLTAQNKNTIFYDSAGHVTTYENHWTQVWSGRFMSVYHKKENTKTLERTSLKEYEEERNKTEKRITNHYRDGKLFPVFHMIDINGDSCNSETWKGKVVVLNFWFIGCAPCEVERTLLNELVTEYASEDVIFISFAKNSKEELLNFIKKYPVFYRVISTEKDFIKSNFEINAYPVNIVLDRNGMVYFDSSASGVGIKEILSEKIIYLLEN